jgi:dTDP-4-dehydrorhamnose 3,5-epimerase
VWVNRKIEGVRVRHLPVHSDERGWLCELFRNDELDENLHPPMAYVSATLPGVTRGPHEHREQTDQFAFVGPSIFRIYLWDNRPSSATFRAHEIIECGAPAPTVVLIPPGVVHAYRNVGSVEGIVTNFPNRLYGGPGRSESIDEIRYEDDPQSPFVLED